jgi:hypothetical protein
MMSASNLMEQIIDQIMSDQKMVALMSDYLAGHGDRFKRHLELLIKTPNPRRTMIEVLRRDPALREQMRAIIGDAERSAARVGAK